jgi:hypothetical protein
MPAEVTAGPDPRLVAFGSGVHERWGSLWHH